MLVTKIMLQQTQKWLLERIHDLLSKPHQVVIINNSLMIKTQQKYKQNNTMKIALFLEN